LVQTIPALDGVYDFIGQLVPLANITPSYDPSTWATVSVGAASGGVKRIFSTATPRLWGGVTTSSIDWAASSVKDAYKTATLETLNGAIVNSDALKAKIANASDGYATYVEKQFKKIMTESYESAFEKKGIINRKYVTADYDFTTNAQKALQKINQEYSMTTYLTKDKTGQEFLKTLAPEGTVDELLETFSKDYIKTISSIDSFSTGALESSLSRNITAVAKVTNKTSLLSTELTGADLRIVITNSVNETVSGVPNSVKQELIEGIYSNVETGFKRATSINDITSTLSSAARRSAGSIPALNAVASEDLAKVGNKLGNLITNNISESSDLSTVIKNESKITKFKNLLKSADFWKGFGWGIACGAVSNTAGMYAYNKSISLTERKTEAESIQVADPSFVFIKGHTYKMIISDIEVGDKIKPIFSEVTETEKTEMLSYLAEKENKQKLLVSNKNKAGENPGERKLQLYLITTNPINAKEVMKQNPSKYTKNLIDNEIKKLISSPAQKLIAKYTAAKIMDDARGIKVDNANRIILGDYSAKEGMVIAIILQAWISQDFGGEDELVKELNGESEYIKQKVLLYLKEVESGTITGETVFPGKGEDFKDRVGMWELIENNSQK
jgi:hypothetical protein